MQRRTRVEMLARTVQMNPISVKRTAQLPISKMLSSTTHTPTGRLAIPKTRRVDVLSAPNTLTSNSDAASATFGCSRNSES